MAMKVLRRVVRINEEKCDGCGACVPACAEGALEIIDGKAKLISERYCDGLGACLGECPQGAITIEERGVEEFDEEAVERHLRARDHRGYPAAATVAQHEGQEATEGAPESMLSNWPVQLALIPPTAPFLQGAQVVLVADCVPFAYAGFHQDLLRDHALLVACPKLDNIQAHLMKLTGILRHSQVKNFTVAHMEVPCCAGLAYMAKQAIRLSGKDIPFREVTIGIRGDLKS